MTRQERLMRTLQGKSVDRPPVSFYELNGLDENPNDKDPFNIYSGPSWKPLIDLTKEKTDRIVMRGISFKGVLPDPIDHFAEIIFYIENKSRHTIKTIKSPELYFLPLISHSEFNRKSTWPLNTS